MGTTNSAPTSRARSMNPPSGVLVPSASAMAAAPLSASARANEPIGVGSGEKVLVSCIIMAMTNLGISVDPPRRRRDLAAEGVEPRGHELGDALLHRREIVGVADAAGEAVDAAGAGQGVHQRPGDEVIAPEDVFLGGVGQGPLQDLH